MIPGSERSLTGGHGNAFQYSCLQNSMDRGVWWTTVHGVANSWTQLKRVSRHVCLFPRAAITKDHSRSDLNNRSVSSHSPAGWKSKLTVSAVLLPSEALLLGLQRPLCVLTWSYLCVYVCPNLFFLLNYFSIDI